MTERFSEAPAKFMQTVRGPKLLSNYMVTLASAREPDEAWMMTTT